MNKRLIKKVAVLVAILITAITTGTTANAQGTRFLTRDFSHDSIGRTKGMAKIYSKTDICQEINTEYIPVGYYTSEDGVYEDNGDVYRIAHYSCFSDFDNPDNCFVATNEANKELLSIYACISKYLYSENSGNIRLEIFPVYDDNNIIAKGIIVEAESMSDDDLYIDEYIPNVEEGYIIDYKTGDIYVDDFDGKEVQSNVGQTFAAPAETEPVPGESVTEYFDEYGYIKGWWRFWDEFWVDILG